MPRLRTIGSCICIYFLFVLFLALSTSSESLEGLPEDNTKYRWGSLNKHPEHSEGGGLGVDLYNFFTSFVNQTRQTVPIIVGHSNFTLIQLALLAAIGSMAAGAATIAAEALVFRQEQSDLDHYHKPLAQHSQRSSASNSYGSPAVSSNSTRKKRDLSSHRIFLKPKEIVGQHSRSKRDTLRKPVKLVPFPSIIPVYQKGFNREYANFYPPSYYPPYRYNSRFKVWDRNRFRPDRNNVRNPVAGNWQMKIK